MLLKSGKGWGYKELARKAARSYGEDRYELAVVDVRSCLFRYLRTVCTARSLWKKMSCIFRIILKGIEAEMMHTFKEAFMAMRVDATYISSRQLYVFCDETRCSYREHLKIADRVAQKAAALEKLRECMSSYKRDLINVNAIIDVHTAFEGYLITHVEEVCLAYNGIEHVFGVAYTKPGQEDSFESDRLCARFTKEKGSVALLSEDYDCIALFGADLMVLEVVDNKICCVRMSDVMDTFGSSNREDLLYRCLLMGTDYNLGVKGIGPVKVQEIDTHAAREKAEECMSLQSLDIDEVRGFFCVT
jgi:hypothetical protein